MITATQLYLITRLDSIHCTLGFAIVSALLFSATCAIAGFLTNVDIYDKDAPTRREQLLRRSRRVFAICVVTMFCESLIPSTKEMAAIIVVPRIANNERLQEAGNRLFDLAAAWMEELSPKKKGGAR